MENVSASECNYILYNVLSNLCQFGEPPLLFQHDNASVHKVSYIKNVFFPPQFAVKELDRAAHGTDVNPIKECHL